MKARFKARHLFAATLLSLSMPVCTSFSQPCDEYRTASISMDESSIVFPTCEGKLAVYNTRTDSSRVLEIDSESALDPAYSFDGQTIYFADQLSSAHWGIFAFNLESEIKAQLTDGFYDRYPRCNQSGTTVYFTRAVMQEDGTEAWGISVLQIETGELTSLVDRNFWRIDGIAVSEEDGKLFFTAKEKRRSSMSLFECNIRDPGSDPSLVMFEGVDAKSTVASNVTFSNDCSRLFFASDRERRFHYDILSCALPGVECSILGLTSEIRVCMSPMIASDCNTLYFLGASRFDGFNRPLFSLWKCRSDGSHATQLLSPRELAYPEGR